MRLFDYDRFEEILMTLQRNKTRSVLTAFGVFWGVMMLILLLGGGNGLQTVMYKQVQGVDFNTCFFMPNGTSLPYKGFGVGRYYSLRNRDIEIIQQRVKSVEAVAPLVFSWSWDASDNTVYRDRSGNFSLQGKDHNYNNMVASKILSGRFINEIDVREKRKVCVIGEKVLSKLFGPGQDPIGEYIRVQGVYYQVIGVATPLSQAINFGGDPDEVISLPYTTMQQAFHMGDDVSMVIALAKDGHSITDIEDQISAVIKSEHMVHPDDKKALFIVNTEKQAKVFKNLFAGITILILIVGVGTLFAGAIGISNIMMVTVKERTQEIGIRRALGARPTQIVSQIMSETALLTAMAGAIGIVVGVLILQAVEKIGHLEGFIIPFSSAIGAAFILVLFSLIAGFAPALRAMKIKAIDALRDE